MRPGRKRLVRAFQLVKFCPPSDCTEFQAVAVVDYRLDCGHTLRRFHRAGNAYQARAGRRVAPATMICPVCSTRGEYLHACVC